MLSQDLVFSNESNGAFGYLASSSVGVTPASDTSDRASFRNYQESRILSKGTWVPLSLFSWHSFTEGGISGSSLFSSQMEVTLSSLSEEEIFPSTSEVQERVVQNSSRLHPDLKHFLLWFILSGYLIACWLLDGKPVLFSNSWAHSMQWPRFRYSHELCDSDLPYLSSSQRTDNWQLQPYQIIQLPVMKRMFLCGSKSHCCY